VSLDLESADYEATMPAVKKDITYILSAAFECTLMQVSLDLESADYEATMADAA
jgi:hypothetical protein